MDHFGQWIDIVCKSLPELENVLGIRVKLELLRSRGERIRRQQQRRRSDSCLCTFEGLPIFILAMLFELRDWRGFQLSAFLAGTHR